MMFHHQNHGRKPWHQYTSNILRLLQMGRVAGASFVDRPIPLQQQQVISFPILSLSVGERHNCNKTIDFEWFFCFTILKLQSRFLILGSRLTIWSGFWNLCFYYLRNAIFQSAIGWIGLLMCSFATRILSLTTNNIFAICRTIIPK